MILNKNKVINYKAIDDLNEYDDELIDNVNCGLFTLIKEDI
jgi:hypothetical protein